MMQINGTPNTFNAPTVGNQAGGIDPQAIMMLLQLVQALQGLMKQAQQQGAGQPQQGAGMPKGGAPGGAAGGAGRPGLRNMDPSQRRQMQQLRRLLGPHFKPLFKQAMCGQLQAPRGCATPQPPKMARPMAPARPAPMNAQNNAQNNANNQNGLININNQININNFGGTQNVAQAQIQGQEKGGWLAQHGGYKRLKDGRYEITKGKMKGCFATRTGKGTFAVTNAQGVQQGVFKAPKGKDKIASPLTFDLNGDGKVSTTNVANGKRFDINGDGKVDKTAWAGKGDGVLAFEANGDGKVGGDGKELLGNNTDVDGDGKADGHANGFQALGALAKKHLGAQAVADGKLDRQELARLSEKTGLGMMVDGKTKSLGELGITDINLGYTEAGQNADENGNEHRQVGAGFVRNGEVGKVNDVWFKYQ